MANDVHEFRLGYFAELVRDHLIVGVVLSFLGDWVIHFDFLQVEGNYFPFSLLFMVG